MWLIPNNAFTMSASEPPKSVNSINETLFTNNCWRVISGIFLNRESCQLLIYANYCLIQLYKNRKHPQAPLSSPRLRTKGIWGEMRNLQGFSSESVSAWSTKTLRSLVFIFRKIRWSKLSMLAWAWCHIARVLRMWLRLCKHCSK